MAAVRTVLLVIVDTISVLFFYSGDCDAIPGPPGMPGPPGPHGLEGFLGKLLAFRMQNRTCVICPVFSCQDPN